MKSLSTCNLTLALLAIFAGITLSRSQSFAQTAPAITTQPKSLTVAANAEAVFTVTATGKPDPTYQWLKGGVAILDPGWQKASLILDGVSTNDETDYSVVVKNSAGTVTSDKATLKIGTPDVIPPPIPVLTTTISLTIKKDGAVWFNPSSRTRLSFECGAGIVIIDLVDGTVQLPDPTVQPLGQTALDWWAAVVAAFPAAKLAIKNSP